MRMLRVVGALPSEAVASLAAFAACETLEDVVRRLDVVDVVVQDEYTHDVIARPASGSVFLVFDTT